jgi:hypothetical protein
MPDEPKQVLILAGPNGAGKTTFAREFLPVEAACLAFINADLIAAGLAPFRPEHAAIRAGGCGARSSGRPFDPRGRHPQALCFGQAILRDCV